jgi:hypothetical protein
MGVLELYAAHQSWNFVERSEGSRPVWNREPGIVAGDQRAGDDEKEGPAGKNDSKAVESAIVRGCDGFQTVPLESGTCLERQTLL